MTRVSLAIAALALSVAACSADPGTAPAADQPLLSSQGLRSLHQVSVGGPDAAGPGADANYSLVAMQDADGTSSGQFTDQWNQGRGSIHVAVDCLHVEGNRAWVGGVVVGGTAGDMGMPILTMVEDNGTSTMDPPDQIAGSWYTDGTITCEAAPELPLSPLYQGQVKVR
jgi:hypothetical protein